MKEIDFYIPTSGVLNSNTQPPNVYYKGVKASSLRTQSQNNGVKLHPSPKESSKLLEHNRQRMELTKEKIRTHKKMKKSGFTEEEIAQELNDIESRSSISVPMTPDLAIFDVFKVLVTVCPPTKRKIDPANLYPTVKPLIDGLTDCGWWVDDNYEHLVEIAFRHGGLSGKKGHYKITLSISEVNDER